MLRDPMCGRKVERTDSTLSAEYKRRKYFFCSPRCQASFQRHAERMRLRDLARVGALLTSGRVRWGLA